MDLSTITALINSPLLGLVSMFVPQAAPIISIIKNFAPAITAAAPGISEAVKSGASAFAAAKASAPAFQDLVARLLPHLPASLSGVPQEVHVENIARMLGGFGRMTPEQEKKWMDDATPGNDPSEENSKRGSG